MKQVFIFLLLCCPTWLIAEYTIQGKINVSDSWQRQIFLSTIDKLDNYYKADPNSIINVTSINEDGTFVLTGDNLPDEKRYYRLFLIKEESSEFDACLYVGGDDHNFVHVILDNNTLIDIISDSTFASPFGNYTQVSDKDNTLMRSLNRLVLPSHYFYQIKFPSELEFSEDKLNRDLVAFADTCSSTLVGLAALNNVDMDNYLELHESVYDAYKTKMEAEFKNHSYTKDFSRKLTYYQSTVDSVEWNKLLGLLPLCIGLIGWLWHQNRQLKRKIKTIQTEEIDKSMQQQPVHLTKQEQNIFHLIQEGKSNKEIAASLYIELSTVKTHINKLYSKLGVKNRKEAMQRMKDQHIV